MVVVLEVNWKWGLDLQCIRYFDEFKKKWLNGYCYDYV